MLSCKYYLNTAGKYLSLWLKYEFMLTVYLVRHGQTQENLARIFQGHLPGTLTEKGKLQAVKLGKRLKDIPLDAVVSSDLKRVTDTVELAVGTRGLPWEKSSLFREIDWGGWTGLCLHSVDLNYPPSDAETREMLYERARNCIDYLCRYYDGKRVLVVAHGQINRCIQACIEQIPFENMKSVQPMQNAEVREFCLLADCL